MSIEISRKKLISNGQNKEKITVKIIELFTPQLSDTF